MKLRRRNEFWTSGTYLVIRAMRNSGNQPGFIARWMQGAREWAERNQGPDAEALRAWLPLWQARPAYTAAELAPIFPALIVALGLSNNLPHPKSAMRLAFELDYGGLPRLRNADGSNLFADLHGVKHIYYVVERVHHWSKQALYQDEFEREILRA